MVLAQRRERSFRIGSTPPDDRRIAARPASALHSAAVVHPAVPRQHFHFVERREIANERAGYEPQPAQIHEVDAELVRVELARPALLPGISCDEELVARDIEHVVSYVELVDQFALNLDSSILSRTTDFSMPSWVQR